MLNFLETFRLFNFYFAGFYSLVVAKEYMAWNNTT